MISSAGIAAAIGNNPLCSYGMEKLESKAARYRREAKACIDVAERMSVRADRLRIMEMAQQWLELAERAEAEGDERPT
jgi:hypothetical protein